MSGGARKGFPTWAKLLIAFGAFGFVTLILAIVAGVRALRDRDDLFDEGKAVIVRGERYASSHTQAECVDEGFREMEKCSGLKCDIYATLFLQECMAKAKASPEMCAQTPKPENPFEMTRWSMAECYRRGHGPLKNQSCTILLQAAARGCHPLPSSRSRQ